MHRLLLALFLTLIVPFTLLFAPVDVHAEQPPLMTQQQDPGANFWNAVRGRVQADTGTVRTQAHGVDSAALVNTGGESWRFFRMNILIPTAAKILGGIAIAILVFRILRGKIRIQAGRTELKIKRFNGFQRLVHWITAILFVGLAITGMFLWFGRSLVIPYLGPELGGDIMYVMKRIHDFSSPAFGVSLLVLALTFLKGNFPHPRDIIWVLKAGGLLGWHAPAGRYNAGEKAWYWVAVVVGGAIVVSGAVMLFPNIFEMGRNGITYYHWIHGFAAIILIGGAMGHIYMGTIAMEGAFECMATGYCDANWAKEHHDVWYEEMRDSGQIGILEDAANAEPNRTQQQSPA